MSVECGSYAAFRRHERRGESPCDECRDAGRTYRTVNRRRARWRSGESQPRTRPECGTYAAEQYHRRYGEPVCDACREARNEYQRQFNRRRSEGRVTIPSVIFDVLETAGISMGLLSLMAWVNELHPEWADLTVKRTLTRLVSEGRVERIEFGDEIRYRMP